MADLPTEFNGTLLQSRRFSGEPRSLRFGLEGIVSVIVNVSLCAEHNEGPNCIRDILKYLVFVCNLGAFLRYDTGKLQSD